uniref:Conserved repeat domain n=2 Tax=Chelativorans TaxID=449972 RepID=Q11DY3_CHESB
MAVAVHICLLCFNFSVSRFDPNPLPSHSHARPDWQRTFRRFRFSICQSLYALAALLACFCAGAWAQSPVLYTTPGTHTPYVVPSNVYRIQVEVAGAGGGGGGQDGGSTRGGAGGRGALITATMAVTPGQSLTAIVGGGGGGGGNNIACSGGGAGGSGEGAGGSGGGAGCTGVSGGGGGGGGGSALVFAGTRILKAGGGGGGQGNARRTGASFNLPGGSGSTSLSQAANCIASSNGASGANYGSGDGSGGGGGGGGYSSGGGGQGYTDVEHPFTVAGFASGGGGSCRSNSSSLWIVTPSATAAGGASGSGAGGAGGNGWVRITPIAARSNLFITKTNSTTSVQAGQQTTYTVRVMNNGPDPVAPLLADPAVTALPKTSVTCSPTPGLCTTPPTITQLQSGSFQLPTLNSGQFYEIRIAATVNATGATVANSAWTQVPTGWTNSGTNCINSGLPAGVTRSFTSSNGRCTVTDTDAVAAQVTVEKTLVGESITRNDVAEPSEVLTYDVRIAHAGGGAFSNFDFVEDIPDGATLTSVTGATGFSQPIKGPAAVNLQVAQVPVGGTATVKIGLTMAPSFPLGVNEITNRVGGGDVPANCSQCEVTIPTTPYVPTFPPTLSCSTPGDFFNTAYDGAGGRLSSGSDPYWGVAATTEDVTGNPPAGLNYTAATVSSLRSGWVSPPTNANWIAHNSDGSHTGNLDIFYKYDFNLDPSVDPGSLDLRMSFYADNSLVQVWVNGVAQNIRSNYGTNDPYQYQSFIAGRQVTATLNRNWQAGLNSIVFHVKSGSPYQGFLAQFQSTAICLPKLTLRKDVVNNHGGTAAESAFTLRAAGPATVQGAMGDPAITNASVPAGTYTLSETGISGYEGSQYICSLDGGPDVVSNSLTLVNGQDAVCTITNDDIAPQLTLIATVVNDNGGTAQPGDVVLSATGPVSISGPSGSAAVTDALVSAGSYALGVAPPANYRAEDYICSINGGTPAMGNSITLALSDVAVCVVRVEDMNPMLTLAKVSVGGTGSFIFNGSAANANGFPTDDTYSLATTAQDVAVEGAPVPLAAADVATEIVEGVPPGWVLETARCEDRRAATTGNPVGPVIGSVSDGRTLVIPAANARAGADLLCTFSNRFAGFAVTGRVIEDNGAGGGTAHDGHQNGTEKGLGAVLLRLTDCASHDYARAESDAAGNFSLSLAGVPANTDICLVRDPVAGHLGVSGQPGTTGGTMTGYNLLRFRPAADTSYHDVVFGLIAVPQLVSGTAAAVPPGGATMIAHRYTATTTAAVSFTLTDVTGTPDAALFSTTLFHDADCSGELAAGEGPPPAPAAVQAGDVICLFVRTEALDSVPPGGELAYTLAAATALSGTQAVLEPAANQDKVTVATGSVTVTKRVRNVTRNGSFAASGTGAPGDVLEYSIIFSNPSPGAVSHVQVHDKTPSYTTLSAPMTVVQDPASLDCAPAVPPAGGSAGYRGVLRWDCTGTMLPGDQGEVSFKVTIDQ